MKYCPACNSQYTDSTLRFCLQDGALLLDVEFKPSNMETVAFSNPATDEKVLKTDEMKLHLPQNNPNRDQIPTQQFSNNTPILPPETKSTKSLKMLWLAAFPILLMILGLGAGGWFYLKNQNQTTARSAASNDSAGVEIAQQTSSSNTNITNSISNTVLDEMALPSNSNAETSPAAGSENIKKEIADAVELWRKATESRKATDYLSKYADKVDYFDKTGAGMPEIRAEAQKMFSSYRDIDVAITNLLVAVDADSARATAVFDKEWSYETEKDLLDGKAKTRLRFQKSGKEWKIIGEKFQKIYYMEN